MGRSTTSPPKLRDGYYIEVRNRNQRLDIKIRRETSDQLLLAIKEYERSKDVIILGKWEDGNMEKIDLSELT